MPQKSSNRASIVLVVFTLLLILGGVYLLNRSMTSSNRTANSTTQSSSPTKSSESETKTSTTTTSQTPSSDKPASETSTSLTTTEEKPETDIAKTTETESSVTSNPTDDTKTAEEKTDEEKKTADITIKNPESLGNNQLTAKYLEMIEGQSRWEITECGLPNAKICVPGSRMRLFDIEKYVTLVAGNEYKFTAVIVENPDGTFSIDPVTKIEALP